VDKNNNLDNCWGMEFINYVSKTFVSVVLPKHKTRAADCKRTLLNMRWYSIFPPTFQPVPIIFTW